MRHGFTLVELMVTIVIISIISVMGVITFTNALVNGRDAERKSDVEVIGRALDVYFRTGGDDANNIGTYPTTARMTQILASSSLLAANFPDLDPKALNAPRTSAETISLVSATAGEISYGSASYPPNLRPVPANTIYIYQPVTASSRPCTGATPDTSVCVRYNIFYMTENQTRVMIYRGSGI